jgi:3-isopropylmalate dehydrogenase
MNILILPGDGIGPEIVTVADAALQALDRRFSIGLELDRQDAGLAALKRVGTTLPDEVAAKARVADGVVLGPASTEDYPLDAKGGINISAWFRSQFDLYANIRPSKIRAGVPGHVPEMDLIIVRENTEGFYADRNMVVGTGEFMPTPDLALAVGKATTEGCRRIAVAAFELAMRRTKRVTAVHKANVLRHYSGLFLKQVDAVAADYPSVTVEKVIVDAMAALLVRSPEKFDVVVTTNMFGDILSDEAAELAGGLGLAASLNVGDQHAIAQAAHGSAPDIAGKNRANPVAMVHSTAMLLDHLGAKHKDEKLNKAARFLAERTDQLLISKTTRTPDLDGSCTTSGFGDALVASILTA